MSEGVPFSVALLAGHPESTALGAASLAELVPFTLEDEAME